MNEQDTFPPEEYEMDEEELHAFLKVQECTDMTFFSGWVAARARLAAMDGHAQLLWLLLKKAPHVRTENKARVNPLTVSIRDSNQETPLMKAVQSGNNITCVGVILEHIRTLGDVARLVVDMTDRLGNTALFMASERGDADTVRLLLLHGANPHIMGVNNVSPLEIAARNGHFECFVALADVALEAKAVGCETWLFDRDAVVVLRHFLRQRETEDKTMAWFYEMMKTRSGDFGNPSEDMVLVLFEHACKVGAVNAVQMMLQMFPISNRIIDAATRGTVHNRHLAIIEVLYPYLSENKLKQMFSSAIRIDSTPTVSWLIAMGVDEHSSIFFPSSLRRAVYHLSCNVVALFLQRGGPHLQRSCLDESLKCALGHMAMSGCSSKRNEQCFRVIGMLRKAGAVCSKQSAAGRLSAGIQKCGDDCMPLLRHLHRHELAHCEPDVGNNLLLAALDAVGVNVVETVRYLVNRMNVSVNNFALDVAAERSKFPECDAAIISFLVDHGATLDGGMLPHTVASVTIVRELLARLPETRVHQSFFSDVDLFMHVRREVIAHLIVRPHLLETCVPFDSLLEPDELENTMYRASNEAVKQSFLEPLFTRRDVERMRSTVFPSGMQGLVLLQRLTFALVEISPQRFTEQGYGDGEWKTPSEILDDLLAAFMSKDVRTCELGKRKRLRR